MNRYIVYSLALIFLFFSSAKLTAARTFDVDDVKGSYAFFFQGEILNVGSVAATGVFRAHGDGTITEAVRTIVVAGTPINQTFTCTYTVNPNGTGAAVCPLDNPVPGFPATEIFDFVLQDKGEHFHLVGTTPGVVVLGGGGRQ